MIATTMEQPPSPSGIILKEYGRNIQRIVDYILTIDDRERRTRFAYTLIELMKQINPSMRDAQDTYQKLWDHLYIMSDFNLDVDTPYLKPEKSIFDKKPMRVIYNTHKLFFKHYGRNVELLISKAIVLEDPAEKEAALLYIGRLMKRFYQAWNKENIDDEIIVQHLALMSNNKLSISVERVKSENLFDSYYKEPSREYKSNGNGYYNNNQNASGVNKKLRDNKKTKKGKD